MPNIKVVQYTDEVRDALRRAMNMPTSSSGKDPYPHAKRQTMIQSSTAEADGGTAAYNGYFTLKDVSTRNEQGQITAVRIAVCDGETWDAENETSGDSYLRVNYNQYAVPCEVLTGVERYIYLECDASTSTPLITLISSAAPKSDDVANNLYYYLLGEWYNNQIIQRHNNGVGNGIAQIWSVILGC